MAAIGVVDYGMGNLHSLAKALQRVSGTERVEVSYDPDKLAKCDRLVLPGVGGVRACMAELKRLELDEFVREQARQKPILGVCLGMQVMLDFPEENEGVEALGLIPGEVLRFPDPPPEGIDGERLKVPHMGWNRVHWEQPHPICAGVPNDAWFYFVHSYFAKPKQEQHVIGRTTYTHPFVSVVGHENVVAVQFHPEKSQGPGMALLTNFVQWDGQSPV